MDQQKKTRMFVYGTLLSEARLATMLLQAITDSQLKEVPHPLVGDVKEDYIVGKLFDSGLGFPYVVEENTSKVHGVVLDIFIDETVLFSAIDKYEGLDKGIFKRLQHVTGSGEKAWVYLAGPATLHAANTRRINSKEVTSGRWMECNYVEEFSILDRLSVGPRGG